jgi:hypothetical protein
MLRHLIHHWERRLYERDERRRVVRPFEWGLEFLGNGHAAHDPRKFIEQFNTEVLSESDRFYTPPPSRAADFDFDGFWLRFPSAVRTPYPENNTAQARFFPAGANDRAVIVLPQWNGDEEAHVAVCRGLNRFGISALRLSLPYHDRRMPAELARADYMVSSNIGRTIQAVQQAVQDARRAADWLRLRGVKRLGIMGTSIGSCVAWLAFVHDERLEVGVFNHVSSYFGDVVWEGITTSHIRQSLEQHLTREEVRRAWLAISPSAYVARMRGHERKALSISARYDLTFPVELSRLFLEDCQRHRVAVHKAFLPCGHYTSGRAPFKFLDGYYIVNFFRQAWKA